MYITKYFDFPIETEHEWRHPLLDLPTKYQSRNAEQLNNIPTLVCSWQVQQGMAPLMLCLCTYRLPDALFSTPKVVMAKFVNMKKQWLLLWENLCHLEFSQLNTLQMVNKFPYLANGKNILTLANGNFLPDQKNRPRTTNGCLTRNRLGLCNMTAGE